MAANLTMVRIATKLDDLFNEKIDISDVKTSDDDRSTFYSRAIAALSIMIQCGIDETLSGSCVTDGYHDMGIDAVYNDSTQKKLVLVQSKWRRDGTGGISQEEAGSFAQGVKRIINSEFEGCNAKISAKQTDIIAALKDMDYQIEVIFCHTGKITRKAAHSTDRITGLFALEGVSLVNGAQTTGSIGAVYADMPDVVARAKVFIQMIDLADTEEEQATQITRFTNTQNRIDGKDFAALDPEQERIKNELSFSGIQYLYKTGATIEDPLHQITLDEAIIAQACSIDELSIVALAKRNVGALTENINKTPYKLLFNGGTNSFSLTNNVWIARVVDSFLAQNESSATGRKRLVLVHGNRFLLHMILSEMKQYANYLTAFFDAKSLPELVNPLCQKYWELTFSAMEEKYPDAYPAHIFKNIGRLREIKEQICLRDSKSQEE